MKKNYLFILGIILMSVLEAFAGIQVDRIPTGAAVVITQPSAVFVTWTIRSTEREAITTVSEEGLFVLGDEVLGRVGTFLTTTIAPNGTGIATETLLVPPDITNRVLSKKLPTFFYKRTFRSIGAGGSGEAQLTCRLSTSAYGNFSIASVTLFFNNERGEATFNQNSSGAQATAEVHYNGTGLMKASWEVQEPGSSQFRVLQQIQYHLTFGDKVILESPQVPSLPTVVAGRHLLRLHIESPVSGFDQPTIAYFVKANVPDEKEEALVLQSPSKRGLANPGTAFEWSGVARGSAILQFIVFEKATLEPATQTSTSLLKTDLFPVKGVLVFSAILPTNSTRYILREEQRNRLHPNKDYLWQIQELDNRGRVMTESELRAFQVAPDSIKN